jgi:hypothetical protein
VPHVLLGLGISSASPTGDCPLAAVSSRWEHVSFRICRSIHDREPPVDTKSAAGRTFHVRPGGGTSGIP